MEIYTAIHDIIERRPDGSQLDELLTWLKELAAAALPYLPENEPKLIEAAERIRDNAPPYKESDTVLFLSRIFKLYTAGMVKALNIPKINGKESKKSDFPVDKVNSQLWKMYSEAPDGQLQINFVTSRPKNKKPTAVAVMINYEELDGVKFNRSLTMYDKKVHNAVASLFRYSGDIMTISQIYYTMGGKTKPRAEQIEAIWHSLNKLGATRILINNCFESEPGDEVQSEENTKYPRVLYDAAILAFERETVVVGGQITDAAIKLLSPPRLYEFAQERKQITTFEAKVLKSPLRYSETNYMLEDYLLDRIAHAKNGNLSATIALDTLFRECGIKTKQQRYKTAPKLEKLLSHYQTTGLIAGYEIGENNIKLILPK